ncbi:hypothetical protein BH23BAC3_BH23BAC3_23290 [soil metagenome]
MKIKNLFLIVLLIAFILTGCTNTGAFLSANQTIVNLNEGNYRISATNISGEATSGYIFGLSYSTGFTANTFAIARVSGSGMVYAEALENLWANFEAENGTVRDQSMALTNVRYDTDILNLIVYLKLKISVRADVIEFD